MSFERKSSRASSGMRFYSVLPVFSLQSDPCRTLKILLKGAGFEVTDEEVMNQHYCSNETYYDHEIFLKNQRAWFMDSVLSSATVEERAAAKARGI
jgi:hypothetical protein